MKKVAGLNCVEVFNDPSAPWVVLFHGFGADADDLAGLTDYFSTSKTYNYLFPQGLLQVPIGGGFYGRAWWEIDIVKLQQAQLSGKARDLSEEIPAGLKLAREKAMALIKAMPTDLDQIVIGGFSQGSMLAVDVYFHLEAQLKGLMILSGNILAKSEIKDLLPKAQGKKFFQSHGDMDPILHMGGADRLYQMLKSAGMQGDFVRFRGGHEIPLPVIQRASEYLSRL